jgi:hypothetical protein
MNINERIVQGYCPLCDQSAKVQTIPISGVPGKSGLDGYSVECIRCGNFSIKHDVLEGLDTPGTRVALSGIAREWTELKRSLEINKDNLRSLINLAPKTLKEKRRSFLQALTRRYPLLNQNCLLIYNRDYPLAYVSSKNELDLIMQYIVEDGLLNWSEPKDGGVSFILRPKAWVEAEAIEKPAALRE